MSALEKITKQFEGQDVTTITYKGQPCWIANEIGQVSGYADNGGRLVTKITHEWKDEFIEGHDFLYLGAAQK